VRDSCTPAIHTMIMSVNVFVFGVIVDGDVNGKLQRGRDVKAAATVVA
jgi:hypothetical protein